MERSITLGNGLTSLNRLAATLQRLAETARIQGFSNGDQEKFSNASRKLLDAIKSGNRDTAFTEFSRILGLLKIFQLSSKRTFEMLDGLNKLMTGHKAEQSDLAEKFSEEVRRRLSEKQKTEWDRYATNNPDILDDIARAAQGMSDDDKIWAVQQLLRGVPGHNVVFALRDRGSGAGMVPPGTPKPTALSSPDGPSNRKVKIAEAGSNEQLGRLAQAKAAGMLKKLKQKLGNGDPESQKKLQAIWNSLSPEYLLSLAAWWQTGKDPETGCSLVNAWYSQAGLQGIRLYRSYITNFKAGIANWEFEARKAGLIGRDDSLDKLRTSLNPISATKLFELKLPESSILKRFRTRVKTQSNYMYFRLEEELLRRVRGQKNRAELKQKLKEIWNELTIDEKLGLAAWWKGSGVPEEAYELAKQWHREAGLEYSQNLESFKSEARRARALWSEKAHGAFSRIILSENETFESLRKKIQNQD